MESEALLKDFENYLQLRSVSSYERYLIYVRDFLLYLKAAELDFPASKTTCT